MTKPIVVCGIDFSGTSMVAGMLHAAGVDMGDVESAEDVAILDRPVRYRTFEDRWLQTMLAPLAANQMRLLPNITDEWLDGLYMAFQTYMRRRNMYCEGDPIEGRRWGVKNNGLLFLAMHPKFREIPVQWVTTYRSFENSLRSCFEKLDEKATYAALLGIEFLAWDQLVKHPDLWITGFNDVIAQPENISRSLCVDLLGYYDPVARQKPIADMVSLINHKTKGVIPWRGSLPQPLSAASS